MLFEQFAQQAGVGQVIEDATLSCSGMSKTIRIAAINGTRLSYSGRWERATRQQPNEQAILQSGACHPRPV
jgi:hypothetical protein